MDTSLYTYMTLDKILYTDLQVRETAQPVAYHDCLGANCITVIYAGPVSDNLLSVYITGYVYMY